jgi:hypothetical protein
MRADRMSYTAVADSCPDCVQRNRHEHHTRARAKRQAAILVLAPYCLPGNLDICILNCDSVGDNWPFTRSGSRGVDPDDHTDGFADVGVFDSCSDRVQRHSRSGAKGSSAELVLASECLGADVNAFATSADPSVGDGILHRPDSRHASPRDDPFSRHSSALSRRYAQAGFSPIWVTCYSTTTVWAPAATVPTQPVAGTDQGDWEVDTGCKEENPAGCPIVLGKKVWLPVACDAFRTRAGRVVLVTVTVSVAVAWRRCCKGQRGYDYSQSSGSLASVLAGFNSTKL